MLNPEKYQQLSLSHHKPLKGIPYAFVYLDHKGEYRWRFIASNGKTTADSGEGYKRISSALLGLTSLYLDMNPEATGPRLRAVVPLANKIDL